MKNRLKVVLDTNVFLVSISSKSKYHWIYEKLLSHKIHLFTYSTKEIEDMKKIRELTKADDYEYQTTTETKLVKKSKKET